MPQNAQTAPRAAAACVALSLYKRPEFSGHHAHQPFGGIQDMMVWCTSALVVDIVNTFGI